MTKPFHPVSCESCQSRSRGIFCELSHANLEDVGRHKIMNAYKKGQTIFFQGNPPFGLFCVNSGKIKIASVGSDGKESIIRIAGAGDVLGHRSLFSHENYNATATVMEDATICFLDKRYVFELLKAQPSIALQLIQKLSKEMGAAEKRTASLSQKNVRERLAELFLNLMHSYGVEEGNRWRLNINLSRDEMASLVGTANETVIRFISQFEEEGILEKEGKTIYICDRKKLVEFANLSN